VGVHVKAHDRCIEFAFMLAMPDNLDEMRFHDLHHRGECFRNALSALSLQAARGQRLEAECLSQALSSEVHGT
jgi:hypothetical protein